MTRPINLRTLTIPDPSGLNLDPPKDQENGFVEEIEECSQPLKLRHVTMVEPVASRGTSEVLHALTLILIRMKSLGIMVNRLHGDRAKELLGRKTEEWCNRHGLRRTLGGGDDPSNNGHVESEIGQLKRRLRLLLSHTKQSLESWPSAIRYAAEERFRSQMQSLGVPQVPMIPYRAEVAVKRKRWHDAGPLAPPYVSGVLLAPSPHMQQGCVVETDQDRIVHVREAILPSVLGDQVALELQEKRGKRKFSWKNHPRFDVGL